MKCVQFLYNLFLYCYYSLAWLGSFFHDKTKKWIAGREQVFLQLEHSNISGCIWFHASSLGEFEQVSYLIERIKSEHPQQKILVTFFSPSGYEAKKNFPHADLVLYLPFDFKDHGQRFVECIQPRLVFWVRYEFWLHMLETIHEKNIPIYLLNGVFYSKVHPFYRPILKKCLSCFTKIFVISEQSRVHLSRLGFPSEICYDTRYDRMLATVNQPWNDDVIQRFIKDRYVVVCGSTWEKDEQIIQKAVEHHQEISWIIVPHEVHASRIDSLKSRFPQACVYSQYSEEHTASVLIVDKIGFLSKLYRYAQIVYVGGGFDKVVHSLIEPLAYAQPILIGKNIEKSEEAREFVREKIVTQIQSDAEFLAEINVLSTEQNASERGKKQLFFQSRQGSINKIISIIKENIEICPTNI